VAKGDFSLIGDLHFIISGIKAYTTNTADIGLETARQACGGAGFALNSGVAFKALNYKPYITFEGDTPVMYQQCARGILKALKNVMTGKKVSLFNEYLTNVQDLKERKCKAQTKDQFESLLEEML